MFHVNTTAITISSHQKSRGAAVLSSVLFLGLSVGACRTVSPSVPRYTVTATPLDIVGAGHPGLCVAIDPTDEHGVSWWEPGPSGCSTRTSGPTVFRAQLATVAANRGSDAIDVRFTLPLMSGSRDVRLLLNDGGLSVTGSGARVPTQRRDDLNIPPAYER